MNRDLFQRQNIPKPVKMVAGVCLLGAIPQFLYFVIFVTTTPIAWFGLGKALFGIVMAIGLLNLRPGWRTFTVFITGLGVLVLPFYVLATIFSTEFVQFVSELTGIQSTSVMLFAEVVGFAMFLFIFICLTRPDVKKAFQSGKPKPEGQATLAN